MRGDDTFSSSGCEDWSALDNKVALDAGVFVEGSEIGLSGSSSGKWGKL